MSFGSRIPSQQQFAQTINFLLYEQFPAIMEGSTELFQAVPVVGKYKNNVKPGIREFGDALHKNASRQIVLTGIGSLFDYEAFGHNIKRPTPQVVGTACSNNSLCLQPTCYNFVEGALENNNLMRNFCWSLAMPCLKDWMYSERNFEEKFNSYISMFFKQPEAVLEGYLRTHLIKESIKVIATQNSFNFSGPIIGGSDNIPLPFYIDPVDAKSFPNLTALEAVYPNFKLGSANLQELVNYIIPSFLSNGYLGMDEGFKVYGIDMDYNMAKLQTASVINGYLDVQTLAILSSMGYNKLESVDQKLTANFINDNLFPRYKRDAAGDIVPVTAESMEAASIVGLVPGNNPEHRLAKIRGLLIVPNSWMYELVEPPMDDFSFLGLGEGLNFRMKSPGVFPVLSSSLFAKNKRVSQTVMVDGVFGGGRLSTNDVKPRSMPLKEAVRTELLMTYSSVECNGAIAGQLPNVGQPVTPQGVADGFAMKSTMYINTAIKGSAKPVLYLFAADEPRGSVPIQTCTVTDVTVDSGARASIQACCPGNQIYVVLTFNKDVSALYNVGDSAIYRSGPKGADFVVTVTAVSGAVVTVQSTDAITILPCCAGTQDTYGSMGELINVTTATATSSEVFKSEYDSGLAILTLGLYDALVPQVATTPATITLKTGQVVNVVLAANASGNYVEVEAAVGETCVLATLDCECLRGAIFSY